MSTQGALLLFPPFAKGSDTSFAAAASMREPAATLRERVWGIVNSAGARGVTCDEVEASTGLAHQTASARINELMRANRIRDTGIRRNTRSGRKAVAWVAASVVRP